MIVKLFFNFLFPIRMSIREIEIILLFLKNKNTICHLKTIINKEEEKFNFLENIINKVANIILDAQESNFVSNIIDIIDKFKKYNKFFIIY